MSTVVVDTAVAKPRGERMRTYAKLFDDADQARVRAELSLFFGPRAETFLLTYEKMRSATGSRRLSPRTWCWPVAIGSFTWFFYRKMYAYGAILIFLPLIFAYLFGYVGGSTWLLFASSAKGHYVNPRFNAFRRPIYWASRGMSAPTIYSAPAASRFPRVSSPD
jgi:hypothetical protein